MRPTSGADAAASAPAWDLARIASLFFGDCLEIDEIGRFA